MPTIGFCTCVPHSSLARYSFAAPLTISRPRGALLKLEIMRSIESSNLQVDGIVETCINVAEINRAREFNRYSILRPWSATSASVLCGLVRMCRCSSLMAGLTNRSLFAEASSLRMRHVARGISHFQFPLTFSLLGEYDCANAESRLNQRFSGSEAVPVCISGIRMPTCLSSLLLASGRIIDPANIPVSQKTKIPINFLHFHVVNGLGFGRTDRESDSLILAWV